MSYGLEEIDEDEYCVHLLDGATMKVMVNENGNLSKTVERFDRHNSREMPCSSLSAELRSFIQARTGKEFETVADE